MVDCPGLILGGSRVTINVRLVPGDRGSTTASSVVV